MFLKHKETRQNTPRAKFPLLRQIIYVHDQSQMRRHMHWPRTKQNPGDLSVPRIPVSLIGAFELPCHSTDIQ